MKATLELDQKGAPLFIGGCARSGTTLLARMLNEKYEFVVTPESQFKINSAMRFEGGLWHVSKRAAINYFKKSKRFHFWEMGDWDTALSDLSGQCLYSEFMLRVIGEYAKEHKLNEAPWLDHTPNNVLLFPILKEVFPAAKIIHIIRDGRAVYNSVKKLPWGPTNAWDGADWWEKQTHAGLALHAYFPDDVLSVKYEDVVNGAAQKDMYDFLDRAGYNDRSSGVAHFKVPSYSTKQHSLVGGQAEKSRIDAYKSSLTEREKEIFTSRVYPLLKTLGYEVTESMVESKLNGIERLALSLRRFYYHEIQYRIINKRRFNS